VFGRNEIAPLQAQFLAFNEWVDDEVVRFSPYSIDPEGGETNPAVPGK
jgi:hypothetical protein